MDKRERQEHDRESTLIVLNPPSITLFEAGSQVGAGLPREIARNPQLIEQASQRRELYALLKDLFAKMPDLTMDVLAAYKENLITDQELIRLYDQLTAFLLRDPNNARLLLYLPFQLLPDFRNPDQLPADVMAAQTRFQSAYVDGWERLLSESSVRANFVDGDILEDELGQGVPTRVRKAAHLIPGLVERGMLTRKQVNWYLNHTKDEELKNSLWEGIQVIDDLPLEMKHAAEQQPGTQWFAQLDSRLEAKFSQLNEKYTPPAEGFGALENRMKWEKKKFRIEIIDQEAIEVAHLLTTRQIALEDLSNLFTLTDEQQSYSLVGVKSILFAAESFAKINQNQAKEFVKSCEVILDALWQTGSTEIRDAIISGWSHWLHLGIIETALLEKYDIKFPDLSLPLPVDLDELIEERLQKVLFAVDFIAQSPELSQFLYPFFVVCGSLLKGYATLESDIDALGFVKTGVPEEKRSQVKDALDKVASEALDTDHIQEFWVREEAQSLRLLYLPEEQQRMTSLKIHSLFGGVWLGKGAEMKRLQDDLLKRYLDLSRFGGKKELVRAHLLRELEADTLQRRLLHSGYRRFYPNQRPAGTEHASAIDGESDFWDPGYRRVATELFISKVFLPDLS